MKTFVLSSFLAGMFFLLSGSHSWLFIRIGLGTFKYTSAQAPPPNPGEIRVSDSLTPPVVLMSNHREQVLWSNGWL